ncbi:DUF6233 domain-containing protein [Streptomyces sp. NPDC002225]|uniref:DUF6233 domain-containing protein n=1 Tax=Streptomyces sp. NPDC002225 TaxID=3154413 RepID=UPI00331A46F9
MGHHRRRSYYPDRGPPRGLLGHGEASAARQPEEAVAALAAGATPCDVCRPDRVLGAP